MMEYWRVSAEAEKTFEWMKWMKDIPFISFPPDWKVKIVPPFGSAVVRFRVSKPPYKGDISVYLDCYDYLGCFGAPYWEIYPFGNDVARFAMNDTGGLINGIAEELERPNDPQA